MKVNKKGRVENKKKLEKKDAGVGGRVRRPAGFPIVGIGASAGGLECFKEFFGKIAPDTGMAFVLVSHLSPGHVSMLSEIIQRVTKMTVVEARDLMTIEPNHVYVIPPNQTMAVFDGSLQLSEPEEPKGQRLPIDIFLRSLADEQEEDAIAVIFSGTGTDGTLGLAAVHDAGGVSFVQDPSTAAYEGMPNSAVRTGLATYVLSVEEIAEQLTAYVKGSFGKKIKPASPAPAATSALNKILLLVRTRTGHDFSLYKKTTIYRRIEWRMSANGIGTNESYARYLAENPAETQLLFKDLLINVTSFFRDPEAFEALREEILPRLFDKKPDNHVFRVWVSGCATGEEAYSIAMVFREYMNTIKRDLKVQIYATDIDEEAIVAARAGLYPDGVAADVPPEALRKFFLKEDAGYRVKKDIREMIIFAVQNVIKDPPFTKLDLLSCRNLLIYLEPELQERLIPVFHYALLPGGVLFLSSSENIGNFSDIFKPINRKWKFFERKTGVLLTPQLMVKTPSRIYGKVAVEPIEHFKFAKPASFTQLIQNVLFQAYVPPSVLSDEKGDIVYVHGDTGKYLKPAQGEARLNVIEMAREGLKLELRVALRNAAANRKSVTCKNIRVKTNGSIHGVDLLVRPVTGKEAAEGLFVISFQEARVSSKRKEIKAPKTSRQKKSGRVKELEEEIVIAKNALQTNIEEQQAFNEELKSTNEELQSTNEELQSTNEELETSKEELQSINEELVTVNSELQAKIEQLSLIQNDMKNLMDSTNIGTIFLDTELAIKRFTRDATKVYCLVNTDIGRPLSDIKPNFEGVDLLADARAVLDSLVPKEKEVRTAGNATYLARIAPYRTLENFIDGVVLTFFDIADRKKSETEAKAARDFAENIIDTIREPFLVLDGELRIISASRSYCKFFRVEPKDIVGRYIYDIDGREWDIARLREILGDVLSNGKGFEDIEVEHDFPRIGPKKMLLNARRITEKSGESLSIFLAMEDITGR